MPPKIQISIFTMWFFNICFCKQLLKIVIIPWFVILGQCDFNKVYWLGLQILTSIVDITHSSFQNLKKKNVPETYPMFLKIALFQFLSNPRSIFHPIFFSAVSFPDTSSCVLLSSHLFPLSLCMLCFFQLHSCHFWIRFALHYHILKNIGTRLYVLIWSLICISKMDPSLKWTVLPLSVSFLRTGNNFLCFLLNFFGDC